MNAQEIAQLVFDKTAVHLMRQGQRSTNLLTSCVYDDGAGRRCAIGCWIPKEKYQPGFEDVNPETLINVGQGREVDAVADVMIAAIVSGIGCAPDAVPWSLLGELQGIHDEVRSERWAEGLILLAKRLGLSLPSELAEHVKPHGDPT